MERNIVGIDRYQKKPLVFFLVGVDGSGKTTIAKWLFDIFYKENIQCQILWSRFNNYFSLPFIGLTKISKHCYYRYYDGVKFGYHDYEKLYFFKYIFYMLQLIDVNIATFFKIKNKYRGNDIVICERGPVDTLVDVVADTNLVSIVNKKISKLYYCQICNEYSFIYIKRSYKKILKSRPGLVHDKKLLLRIKIYDELAKKNKWHIVDNNNSINSTKRKISRIIFH